MFCVKGDIKERKDLGYPGRSEGSSLNFAPNIE